MIILGIDPGSRRMGFGVIEVKLKVINYITCGYISLEKLPNVGAKLQQIYKDVTAIIKQYKPEHGAIEQVFVHKNPASALKLGQARGAAIVAIANQQLVLGEYSAREVKQAVVGYGNADKAQVQHMIATLLSLQQAPQADAADALAIAMCHANSLTQKLRVLS